MKGPSPSIFPLLVPPDEDGDDDVKDVDSLARFILFLNLEKFVVTVSGANGRNLARKSV